MNAGKNITRSIRYFDLVIMAFIFVVLFGMPVIFTRVNGAVSWHHVTKIWIDQVLLLPLFLLNHWVLVPRLLFRKQSFGYIVSIVTLVLVLAFGFKYFEQKVFNVQQNEAQRPVNKPAPVPPFANLLMYSLLIVGVDTGLLMTRRRNELEENKHLLEVRNAEMQLDMLKNQVSPHFFMNTLNNIYALIDCDTPRAKEAVMKLSKLMRYMLYENEQGWVKISREFEFIRSYIDLMKLRYADDVTIRLLFPKELENIQIPPMLFICYIENAFKHGVSYQQDSFINIVFEKRDDKLHFSATNSRYPEATKQTTGGLGLKNNENRLRLLFSDRYSLNINSSELLFNVTLEIPVT